MSGSVPTNPVPNQPRRGGEAAGAPEKDAFERVPPSLRPKALARLLGQGRQAGEAQVRQFLQAAEDLQLSLEHLWGRRAADGSFDCAILIAPQAGGTGMAFVSRPRGMGDVAVHADLADFAARHTPSDQVKMAQALLSTDQELERAALERGGFEKLATLTYMQRRIAHGPPPPAGDDRAEASDRINWPDNVRLLTYNEQRRPQFIAALEASYEQTLDCPALYGRRDIHDVLRGHMATGQFDPELWTLLLVDEKPAGVMLLNRIPSAGTIELVYLGLGVAYRGRGLAAKLLERGIELCRRTQESYLSLAVDEGNAPAKRLYDRFGFRRTTRKIALIRHLRPR